GFQPQINKIIAAIPKERQTLFFSATVPPEIRKLADSILRTPTHVAVAPVSSATESVTQHRYQVPKANKRRLMIHLLDHVLTGQALVFTRTKRGADRVAKDLEKEGVGVGTLHGDKSQAARQKALRDFKTGRTRVLVATDIAARGIDVSELPYVINFDVPESPETYVHRIGRTGRAGSEGLAITLCTREEEGDIRAIEKLLKTKIMIINDHPYHKVIDEPGETSSDRQSDERPERPRASSYSDRPRSSSSSSDRPSSSASSDTRSDKPREYRRDDKPKSSSSRPQQRSQGSSRSSGSARGSESRDRSRR
ncbi:MAG: DEAD/DEAH box helicase, partial [Ignavibacteriae bacterium]